MSLVFIVFYCSEPQGWDSVVISHLGQGFLCSRSLVWHFTLLYLCLRSCHCCRRSLFGALTSSAILAKALRVSGVFHTFCTVFQRLVLVSVIVSRLGLGHGLAIFTSIMQLVVCCHQPFWHRLYLFGSSFRFTAS